MFWGFRSGLTDNEAVSGLFGSFCLDVLLLIQFPIVHSLLLSKKGRKLLERVSIDRRLSTTTFALISSFQIVLLFKLWSPSGIVLYSLNQPIKLLFDVLYGLSWIFLARSMLDAGLSYQTGAIGWWSVFRKRNPLYPNMPTKGSFKVVRQPIYLAFLLILWTSPSGTLDRLLLAICWGVYLLSAPKLKEKRFLFFFGEEFEKYKRSVPYFFPRFFNRSN
jgi:protein-S-isoprenylcysteine O-methyltransferase Ste14